MYNKCSTEITTQEVVHLHLDCAIQKFSLLITQALFSSEVAASNQNSRVGFHMCKQICKISS